MDELSAILKRSSGLYSLGDESTPNEVAQTAKRHGYRFFHIDGNEVTTPGEFLEKAQTVMAFPRYFGHNWDALLDMLRDLSWCPASGYILLYSDCQRFAQQDHAGFAIAMDVLREAAQFWDKRMKNRPPLYILLQGDLTVLSG